MQDMGTEMQQPEQPMHSQEVRWPTKCWPGSYSGSFFNISTFTTWPYQDWQLCHRSSNWSCISSFATGQCYLSTIQ
jgi:hypothetical protein